MMKKKYKYLFSLTLGLLCSPYVGYAQQLVQLTTSKAVGSEITLVVNRSGAVSVDFGDGKPVAATNDTIKGLLKGNVVKITGNDYWYLLDCSANGLTAIELAKAPALKTLFCNDNALTTLQLDAQHLLSDLDCSENKLTDLDLNANTELQVLDCSHNAISSLSLNRNVALNWLSAQHNKIKSLFLVNKQLDAVDLSDNALTSLSLTQASNISTFLADNNALTSFRASSSKGLPLLQQLSLKGNKLKEVDLSKNMEMLDVILQDNSLNLIEIPADLKLSYYNIANNVLSFNSFPKMLATPNNFVYAPQGIFELPLKTLAKSPSNVTLHTAKDTINVLPYITDLGGIRSASIKWYYADGKAISPKVAKQVKAGVYCFTEDIAHAYGIIESKVYPQLTIRTSTLSVGNPVGIDQATATAQNALSVRTMPTGLKISAAIPTPTKVYTADGKLLWQGTIDSNDTYISLPKGLYIVNQLKVVL